MSKLFNLARMSTATTGTGTITLGSNASGHLSFANAGVSDGDYVTYGIIDGTESEVGRGLYTASGTTLTRNVITSTNSNTAINLSGTAEVFITGIAEDFNALSNTSGQYTVNLAAGTNVTANRTLTLTTGDANRTLDISAGSVTISTAGAALIDDADAAAQRTTLGLGTMAVETASDYLTTAAATAGYQPLDSDLTSWAGVTRASGFDTFATTPSSANLRSLLTDESGTGVAYFQGGDLGTPSAGVLTNATGLPVSTGISGLGTGVATALAVNVGSAGAPIVNGGALGTPASGTLTNATGLPIATGVSGLGSGVATFLATPSSANLASAVTDETGSGALVFATSPSLTTPNLGTPSAATLTNATGLPVATGISGLGSNVATFLATPSSANLAAALTDETGTGAAVFGTAPTLTNSLTLTSTDSGASAAPDLLLYRDSSSPAASDVLAQIKFDGRGSGANLQTYGTISGQISSPTNTSESGALLFGVVTAGTVANEVRLDGSALSPVTSDGNALGTSSLMWSDLFLASGGVVNFNNGDVTLTHSADTLTMAGGNLSLGTTASLTTGTIELGHASDTTISRSSAGNIAVEGNVVYRAGGTDVALADGGTGASLADPNADRIMFWDDSAGSVAWLTPGTGLTISGTTIAAVIDGLFVKADIDSVAFTKTGNGTAQVKAGTKIEVDGVLVTFASATSITMPALTAGTDYAIYVCTDGTIRADSSFTAPSGYTTSNSRQVGGFHYAPGGNAAALAGGNTTAQINEYSFWDLKWRPACPDPRGMTLVADSFWCDIYLTGVDHHTNGTSKYNVTIADGAAPPKIPSKFGGNGSTAYSNYTWWNAAEVLQSHGKSPLSYDEFAAAAYGTTEATSSGGSGVPTTGVSGTGATSAWNVFTSKWGVIQSSGCIWVWGDEFGGGAAAASWTANTDSRGSTFQMENAALWGGGWNTGSFSGSRCSYWRYSPSDSYDIIGSRGRCDHLRLV